MDKSLFHLDLSPKILNELRNAKFTTLGTVLSKSNDLRRLLRLETKEVDHILKVLTDEVLRPRGPIVTVSQLHSNGSQIDVRGNQSEIKYCSRRLSTGCPVLNRILIGGIPQQGITEICGESGSGKTQLGLQVSLAIQKPPNEGGMNAATLYVCTEDAFPIKRLKQLIDHLSDTVGSSDQKVYSDRVFVEHVEDSDGLIEVLQKKLPLLITHHNVKLLIIDSIAGVFRSQYEDTEVVKRAQKLYLVGSILHTLNDQHEVSIICINQVTDVIDESRSDNFGRKLTPSLGLSWSNIVNTRITLTRTNELHQRSLGFPVHEKSIHYDIIKRKLAINFSPFLPPICCCFIVNYSGVHALEEYCELNVRETNVQ